ncbi:MAG: glycerol-3-phosphate acyltransferase [Patescibacteria group bacterium]
MENMFYYILFGYLVGSISPGYFFGRVIKRVDIRKLGSHNTGASNTYRIVGPAFGIITAMLDLAKAPLVYYLSLSKINPDLAIIVGLAAVLGHIFPFYLGFRGGRGAASLNGLFLISLFYSSPIYSLALFLGILIYYLGFIHPVKISIRHYLKLFSLIFPLGLIWLSNTLILVILAVLLLISFVFDLARFFIPTLNEKYLSKKIFSKSKEKFRFSGYSLFLFSSFFVVALFPKEIAALSLVFFILGDTLAPFSANIAYLPQKRMMGEKTIAGFVVVSLFSFFAGWFLYLLTPLNLSLKIIILGALLTAIFDQLSFWVDDNLLVPIGTATVLLFLT